MKNQFVGDINDYYKYGLLRILSALGKKEIGICWMLKPDRTEYLNDPKKWRDFDPALFDKLRRIVRARNVRRIEKAGILPRARFHTEPFTPGLRHRGKYFDQMLRKCAGVYLIFFDPDVGLAPSAGKHSNKYLPVSELGRAFGKGHSVLVIQFPWFKKDWIRQHANRIREATRAAKIYTFRTPAVVFFLAVQQRHVHFFRRRAKEVKKRWGSIVTVNPDPESE
jgi:hypothetical protein